jgi:hypothetical protein
MFASRLRRAVSTTSFARVSAKRFTSTESGAAGTEAGAGQSAGSSSGKSFFESAKESATVDNFLKVGLVSYFLDSIYESKNKRSDNGESIKFIQGQMVSYEKSLVDSEARLNAKISEVESRYEKRMDKSDEKLDKLEKKFDKFENKVDISLSNIENSLKELAAKKR